MKLHTSIFTALSIMLNAKHALAGMVEMTSDPVEDSYVVILKKGGVFSQSGSVHQRANYLSRANSNFAIKKVYEKAINGFSAQMTLKQAEALVDSDEVESVHQDGYVSINQQSPATWGIDRVDQRDLPLSNSFSPLGNGGSGVTAYIIDTGIRTSHNEFGGRATFGINTTNDNNNSDCNGHGTHVAGTVGGATYGVAKNVQLVDVKVLGCNGSGTFGGVIEGIEWAMADAVGKKATANLSLGGGKYAPVDLAVKNLHLAGVVTVVAAGNSNDNACNYSPAGEPVVLTVGSTTSSDSRSGFSNYGTCVDIMAPGSSITSAWYQSNTQTRTISGTSMASPHVCGGAALLLGNGVAATDVESELKSIASTGKIVGSLPAGTPNLLLYVGADASTDSPSAAPVASTESPSAAPVASTDSPSAAPFVLSENPSASPVALTDSPSMEPTSATDSPSMEPTGDVECIDSPKAFGPPRRRQTCDTLRPVQKRKWKFKTHCPLTTDTCNSLMCSDSKIAFFVHDDTTKRQKNKCLRIKKMKNKDRQNEWCNKPGVRETCRETCNYCS